MEKLPFESFVNSERCKTALYIFSAMVSLRALLIQKDAKRIVNTYLDAFV